MQWWLWNAGEKWDTSVAAILSAEGIYPRADTARRRIKRRTNEHQRKKTPVIIH